MDRINQYAFYDLGKLFREFGTVNQDVPGAAVFFLLLQAQAYLKRLLYEGIPVQLGLSRGPAQDLLTTIEQIYQETYPPAKDVGDTGTTGRFPEMSSDQTIQSWRWNSISYAITRFETVFQEEMREAATYSVPRRGIYSTPILIDHADLTFPSEIRGCIPEKALNEWRGAGRCLAFGLLSASGFHVARAVEGMMEAYYAMFCGVGGKAMKTWNDYIDSLESIDQGAKLLPTPKTLAELRQMKDNYRNPIMHPRVVLTEPDARMLFNDGESVIIAMAQEMKAVADKGQPSLNLVRPDDEAATP